MDGSYVNFHNFSIDPVRVKIGECYSYARMILGKIRNLLLDTFQQGFLIMLKIDMPSVILDTASYACPMALKFYGSPGEA